MIKATLFNVNKGFKIVSEKIFDDEKMPINCFNKSKAINQKPICENNYEVNYPFHYYWIMCLMFPDDIVVDYQNKTNYTENGHPDFIIYNKDNPTKKKYVEFKSYGDGLRKSQIRWFANNREKRNYILFIEDYFEGI